MNFFAFDRGPPNLRDTIAVKARYVALLLTVLAAGCTPLIERFESETEPRQVFAVGLENLTDRYIKPIKTSDVTMAGLSALTSIDESANVFRVGDKVQLRINEELTTERPVPHEQDAYGWAWLAAAIIKDARKASPALRAARNEEIYAKVFAGALSGLDRYSRYTGPEASRRNRAARDGFGGLGISINVRDGITVVTKVNEDSPARRAGVLESDHIIRIDGVPVYGLSQGKVVNRLRGPVNLPVKLAIRRANAAEPILLSVIRSHIIPPTVTATRWKTLLHIKITSFNQGTQPSLKRVLKRAEVDFGTTIKGLILDLRDNPGGLLDQAVEIADLFLGDGRIITTNGRHPESNQIFDAAAGEIVGGLPVAVLVNGRSASAAEILAVALRDRGRAVVLGSSSYGKGTVQTIIRLPNGGELILTWARIHAPSGQTLDHQAIVPAFCTNGDNATIGRTLAMLRSAANSGSTLPTAGNQAPRKGPHYSAKAHAACPPSAKKPDSDLEAARLLIGNRAAYQQARLNRPSSTAKR